MKWLSILTILLALSTVACGESATEDESTQNQENAQSNTSEPSLDTDSDSQTPDTNSEADNSDSNDPDSNSEPEVGDVPGDGSDENDPVSNLEFEPGTDADFSADNSSVLQNLSGDEVATFCAEFEQYLDETGTMEAAQNFMCTFGAIFQAPQPSAQCEDIRQECLEEDLSTTSDCESGFADCGATVAELEACLPVYSGFLLASSALLNCETSQSDMNDIMYYDIAAHEDCAAVAQSCPAFFNDDD